MKPKKYSNKSISFKYLKQFTAGALPALAIYLAAFAASFLYAPLARPLELWWIIIVFGLANIVYFMFIEKGIVILEDWNLRMHIVGFTLGLFTAVVLVVTYGYAFNLMDKIIRIIVAPIVGALVWRYIVHNLNLKFGIKD